LAIVKHIIGRHDGEIRISSQLGVGSSFTCAFPAEVTLNRRLQKSVAQDNKNPIRDEQPELLDSSPE
jgi:two-component system phosphate regulon sensor histidine kinase PhoR